MMNEDLASLLQARKDNSFTFYDLNVMLSFWEKLIYILFLHHYILSLNF